MITFKQFMTEAYNVWTYKENVLGAAKKHVADLKAAGHKILGTEYHPQHEFNGEKIDSARILTKNPAGKHEYHAFNSVTKSDRSDPRISKEANSTRVMRGATKMHMSMKGKFHSDLK